MCSLRTIGDVAFVTSSASWCADGPDADRDQRLPNRMHVRARCEITHFRVPQGAVVARPRPQRCDRPLSLLGKVINALDLDPPRQC